MSAKPTPAYDPGTYQGLTFHDSVAEFRNGSDTPRAYLERCLATVGAVSYTHLTLPTTPYV